MCCKKGAGPTPAGTCLRSAASCAPARALRRAPCCRCHAALPDPEVLPPTPPPTPPSTPPSTPPLTHPRHHPPTHPPSPAPPRQIDEVLGDRRPSFEDWRALPYTSRVVAESMRLYPQPPVLIRRALGDDELGGYKVPAGSDIFISTWNLHRCVCVCVLVVRCSTGLPPPCRLWWKVLLRRRARGSLLPSPLAHASPACAISPSSSHAPARPGPTRALNTQVCCAVGRARRVQARALPAGRPHAQ